MVDTMNVFLYPNKPSDDDLVPDAREGIKSVTDQTIDYFSSNGENISRNIEVFSDPVYSDYPRVSLSAEKGEEQRQSILDRFRVWRNNNSQETTQRTGAHLLLTHGVGGGYSEGRFGGAWRNPPMAIASLAGNQSTSYFKSLCIHECYHLFINIGYRVGAGDPYNDHILGHVLPNGPDAGKQTPMLNGYLDKGLATKGSCNNTGKDNGHTTTLSDCALDKTLESYQNQGNVV